MKSDDEELEAVVREMRQILDTRACEPHAGKRSFVT
jgi:hypothetical protein